MTTNSQIWIPMFTLPNVDVRKPIEADGLALVPADDERITALRRKQRRFDMYLRRFTTEFGDQIARSTIICHGEKFAHYRSSEALAAFRDAIAISAISLAWTHALRYENNHNIRYANWFTFYPWLVDNKYDRLVMQSMAQLGAHEVRAMKGQSSPGVTHMALTSRMIDAPLLTYLLEHWSARFNNPNPDRKQIALFRALNMALSAAMLPGNVEVTIYDIGRSVALWVSAFEILSKDGSYGGVCKLLESVTWNLTACKEAIYEPHKYKAGQPKRSLPIWLYGALNHARNDFLHGNPVEPSRLIVPPGKQPLHLYTAPLFRMALTAFLDLKRVPQPPRQNQTEYEAYMEYSHNFGHFQSDIEAAISTILYTRDEYRAHRQGRIQSARSRSRLVNR